MANGYYDALTPEQRAQALEQLGEQRWKDAENGTYAKSSNYLPSFGHDIGQTFKVGKVNVRLTAADHAYQNAYPGMSKRIFKNEDACGFMIETPDGTIWATGDSRLLPEHLKYTPAPDAIFSDSEWHFTFEGAVKIANTYPNTPLLLCHWGSVDSPDFAPFNGDPEKLKKHVVNPDRIYVLAAGEPFILRG